MTKKLSLYNYDSTKGFKIKRGLLGRFESLEDSLRNCRLAKQKDVQDLIAYLENVRLEIPKWFKVKRELFGRFGHLTGKRITQTQLENSLINNKLATQKNVQKLIAYLEKEGVVKYTPYADKMYLIRNEEGTYRMGKLVGPL